MEENYSLSDIAAVLGGNGTGAFGSGGGFMWIFALLILVLLCGNGGGLFGGAAGAPATQTDLMMNTQFNELQRSVGEIADRQFTQANGLTKGICELGYTTAQQAYGIQSQLADCCCTTQRAIDSIRFDMANYSAAIQATDTANTQKVLDAICQNKIESLQNQVNNLQLRQVVGEATYGMVRYPQAITYTAGSSPFCANNGCGYQNAI